MGIKTMKRYVVSYCSKFATWNVYKKAFHYNEYEFMESELKEISDNPQFDLLSIDVEYW